MSNKRIINCAITGSVHSPSMSPHLPITPEQIAQSAIDAANAGAASVHIHARNPENGAPSSDLELFRRIIGMIQDKNGDVIICITTGGGVGMTIEQRSAVIPAFSPELASMNAGSFNWGLFPLAANPKMQWQYDWEKPMYESTTSFIFQNTFADMASMLQIFNTNGAKPELECYDAGHIYNVKFLQDSGLIKGKPFLQFVLGINGALGASPENLTDLKHIADRTLGVGGYEFSGFGAGKMEYPVCLQSLLLGGHVRVGLEDNLYLSKGKLATSNAEMVEKVANLMELLDFEIATPQEAREILDLNTR